ncbi:Uncharacterised protein [Candidatus Bilamarchaeum dharawalense]|uniref:DUF4870 domain-containing protein n=1 Tax=Candidatus Bilamarchaeum dharawalense TaxID=2885759 RepID=A0A5E4LSP4_9ARCH|nr:Uncharacterised protein [Candidatus Bilamarchaeum dharawalense]
MVEDRDSYIFGAIGYIFGIMIALILFIVKKDDQYVKYHTAQAILFDIFVMFVSSFIAIAAFALVFVIGGANFLGFFASFWIVWIVVMAFSLVMFVLRLFFAWKAYNGSRFRLPIISSFADKIIIK